MKIREKTVVVKEFVLEAHDIGTIKKALDYCKHRLTKHEDKKLDKFLNLNHINHLLQQFK